MFLLPGAERYRRVMICGGIVLVLMVQAVVPWQPLEDTCNHFFGPLLRPLTEASAVTAEFIRPTAEPADSNQALAGSVLVAMERRLGLPQALPGMKWLEVPVLAVEPQVGRITVAAGADFHLAEGQLVAYGSQYIGRVSAVKPFQATVELVTAPNVRTGVLLTDSDGLQTKGVSLGRGRAGAAVLPWLQSTDRLHEGQVLTWRPRPLDPPNLSAAQLHLGMTSREGDVQRGNAVWTIDGKLPAAAEGRLYIAASAVGERLVAEPVQVRTAAKRLLLDDAVLGAGWCAVASSTEQPPAVFVDRGQVGGWCSSWRGNWGWFRRVSAWQWQQDAVALETTSGQVLDVAQWQSADSALPLFTRGGGGVPRGLWLGNRDSPALLPASQLLVIVQQDGAAGAAAGAGAGAAAGAAQ